MANRGKLCKHILLPVLTGWLTVAVSLGGHALATLPLDEVEQRGLQQLIRETEVSLQSEKWLEAAERFDRAWKMACEDEDPLMVATGADVRQLASGETELLAGGKARLEDLFYRSPGDFRAEFARQFSELAAAQITQALTAGDFDEVRQRTTRFAFCPAAREGLLLLAKRSMDRNDFLEAALLLGRLQRMNNEPEPSVVVQMALCYALAGLHSDAADVINRLQTDKGLTSIRLGNQDVPLPKSPAETTAWLTRQTRTEKKKLGGWLQPGGSYRRVATQPLGPSSFATLWKSSLFEVQDILYSEQYNPFLAEFPDPIEREAQRLLARNSTIVPAAHPLIVGENAIIRTPFGIRSVNLKSGELQWEVTRPDSRLKVIIDERTAEPRGENVRPNDGFSRVYLDPRAQLLYQMLRTNTASQMAVNGDTLFVVDESSNAVWSDDFGMVVSVDGNLTIPSNYIRAYDVNTGLFKWEVGGQTQNAALPAGRGNLLAGFYFLGAPLVLGQRTYVLAESGEGLFLVQIAEPTAGITADAEVDPGLIISDAQMAGNPRVVSSQILTVPEYKLPQHPVRKHAGLVPSFAQGLLICPTCDRRIVAVSAEDRSLRWIFRYAGNTKQQEIGGDNIVLFGGRDAMDTRSVDLDSRWIDSLPRIADGKVLVTPRDSDQLYCLDLQTGLKLWAVPRNAFHAVGTVTSDRVVLVGNQRVAALKLSDGSPLWSTELRDGIVCGTSTSDGKVIQIPTNAPSIVTLNLENGQRLVGQSDELDKIPGNLLMTEHGLLSQNLLNVTFSAAKVTTEPPTPVVRATELLLNRNTAEAQQILDQEVVKSPKNLVAREMLIELLLEGLRADFAAHQASVPRLRELIELSSRDISIAPLLHSLFGMNLPDAAVLPRQMRGRSGRYQGELSELIAKGMASDTATSAELLTANIRQLLSELPAARRQIVNSGFMVRSKGTILTAGIREAIKARSSAEQLEIQDNLKAAVLEVFQKLPDDESRSGYVSGIFSAGLPELALALLEHSNQQTPIADRGDWRWLMQEFARLEISQSSSSNAAAAANALLDSWNQLKDRTAIDAWLQGVSQLAAAAATQRFQMPNEAAREAHTTGWKAANPETVTPVPSIWPGMPVKEESAERTMLDPFKAPDGIPDKFIPLYGTPGIYRGWSFVRVRPAGELHAYDADGVLRWKMQPYDVADDSRYGFAADSYVMAYGHLLTLNVSGTLFAIDPTRLNKEGEPLELWRKNIERLAPDTEANQFREYVPPSDRVPQYFPQPAGYFPAGPVTPFGVPIISGRRLIVLEPLTGARIWQTDGVPRDAVLLCSGDKLLIVSEGASQIEVRSLVDGSVRAVSPIPEWWGDANANVGSSVQDIEVEEGVDIVWRIVLQGQSCVLFRLTRGKAILESRDLLTDAVTWSIELPQETIFSNVAEDVVAVLSEGEQLKLVQTDTGKVLTDLTVMKATNPRQLILRQSSGHYIVLPEAVAADSEEFDPIIDAMHVTGRIYSVREDTMQLAWDQPLDNRHIRLAIPERSVQLPNVPVLLLLTRGGQTLPRSPIRRTHYGAVILDVRTGEEIYRDEDVGTTLNSLWMHIDSVARKLQISFDSRIVTLDYAAKAAERPAP